jgi:hypothetical protein
VILLATVIVEGLGLTLGRYMHRGAALAYFAAAGGWQLVEAARSMGSGPSGGWLASLLGTGGVLFAIQAVVQYLRYRQAQRRWLLPDPLDEPVGLVASSVQIPLADDPSQLSVGANLAAAGGEPALIEAKPLAEPQP